MRSDKLVHRKYSLLLASLLWLWNQPLDAFSQESAVPVFQVDDISELVEAAPESIHIFSFWATWCAPCLKEINLIKSVEAGCDCDLQLHFINMEEKIRQPKALKTATKKGFPNQLYFTKNVNADFYEGVDPAWTGTFPALLMIDGKTRKRWFSNQLINRKKLTDMIHSFGPE